MTPLEKVALLDKMMLLKQNNSVRKTTLLGKWQPVERPLTLSGLSGEGLVTVC